MAAPEAAVQDPELEEDYDSESDEDFNPDAVPEPEAEDSAASSEEEEAPPAAKSSKPTKRKRKAAPAVELDSGDEATIEERRHAKKRKSGGKGAVADDWVLSEDEGGEGGLIKTRAQRRVEEKERRPLARTDGATIDVNAIWAQMNANPFAPPASPPREIKDNSAKKENASNIGAVPQPPQDVDPNEEMITIKRTYDFAGQRVEEEREVPKNSEEARLYLASLAGQKPEAPESAPDTPKSTNPALRRPLRRPSRFDPNPTGEVKALPPDKQLFWRRKSKALTDLENAPDTAVAAPRVLPKAQKLTTVDKSRLDWVQFVDKEGVAEELDEYGKSKEGYLGRTMFLQQVEARREAERREARLAGAA